MIQIRRAGEKMRAFIIAELEQHPADIARHAAAHFGVSRQAISKHLGNLCEEGAIVPTGTTRNRTYKLAPLATLTKRYKLKPGLAEDVVWREDIVPFLGQLPENVLRIWNHVFTEMFNNAIDHSGGKVITVSLSKTAVSTDIWILDDGVGIFRKIQQALGLLDERHAILELSKGKLTTDPKHHSGEGIFFSSRMVDDFAILSGATYFSHTFGDLRDWILERPAPSDGTSVAMRLNNHTARTTKKIFSEYTSGEDFGFTKTVVPVRLAQYGDDALVSRSQAKRLLARVDRFKTVMLDFADVKSIGQSFADEIFRVFRRQHPDIEIYGFNANTDVQQMINRAETSDQ